ncbi:trehalose-phosphatase [Aurantiacibacter aquimixticola]|uniref:Trehalose 6-phosphate phosphatase n=1 Tax=Aurantiacibacter aquimixticola TaxID=1958945 RepID=A0A419RSF5_9SPHN|nr:trehalose-phosphatase [Aurantiacibacter aquimixticola]RJY08684.1 trehalose-phosphatase [Aurantiacibacter aquimixticola]
MTQDLPSPPRLETLAADKPISLFLDFDGTLVDIAPTPDAIEVPSDLLDKLAALAERHDGRVALVSGRAIDDLEGHLGRVTLACAGSHGSHCRDADGGVVGDVPGALAEDVLDEVSNFAAAEGFSREDKAHGVALHYRSDPSLENRGLAFAQKLAERHELQVKRGKRVIELTARGGGKADAVRAFMETEPFKGSHPVFVGDDVTDEDGMRAATDLGGVGIAVGERPSENAKYALANPAAVHQWLGL